MRRRESCDVGPRPDPPGLLLGALGVASAGYVAYRRIVAAPRLPQGVVSIVTPVIHPGVAEEVLEKIEPLAGDEVTVLLHTFGGCVSSCVQITRSMLLITGPCP